MTAVHLTNQYDLHGSRQKASGAVRRFFVCRATHPAHIQPLTLAAALLCACFVLSCATTPPSTPTAESYIPSAFDWQPICDGAAYTVHESASVPVRYHCVKIDLTAPGLAITAFPASERDFLQKNGTRTQYFIGRRTGAFARHSGATVAINTSPFAGKNGKWDVYAHVTRTRQIVGTHIVAGAELAAPNSRYCALVLTRSGGGFLAHIADSQSEEALSRADYAFGGFWTILRAGAVLPFAAETHDSRTACGISGDGRTLYLLAVEGERKRHSAGLSYPECALVFKALGAESAMEFDGGGSTSLFINGRNVLSYPALRTNAASIGFTFKTARSH